MKSLLMALFVSLLFQPSVHATEDVLSANSDIPPEALEEREQMYQQCQSDQTLSYHFKCDCYSNRFLEKRMLEGPKKPRLAIQMQIMDSCFNIPGAAEYSLNKCKGYINAHYDGGMSREDYCQCVSDNYAIDFSRSEGMVTRNKLNRFMSTSIQRCQTPNPGDINPWPRLDQ